MATALEQAPLQSSDVATMTLLNRKLKEIYNRGGSEALAYAATLTPVFVGAPKHKAVGALTGAITVANPVTIPDAGDIVALSFLQDATGGRAVSWGNAYIFPTAWSNTSNTANKRSTINFRSDGTQLVAMGANSWA